eukprot:scaffold18267_cov146-Isochrysis_galbana.AAC.2
MAPALFGVWYTSARPDTHRHTRTSTLLHTQLECKQTTTRNNGNGRSEHSPPPRDDEAPVAISAHDIGTNLERHPGGSGCSTCHFGREVLS